MPCFKNGSGAGYEATTPEHAPYTTPRNYDNHTNRPLPEWPISSAAGRGNHGIENPNSEIEHDYEIEPE